MNLQWALLVQFLHTPLKKKINLRQPIQILLKSNCRSPVLREDISKFMLSKNRNKIQASMKSVGIWGVGSPCTAGDLDYAVYLRVDLVKLLLVIVVS